MVYWFRTVVPGAQQVFSEKFWAIVAVILGEKNQDLVDSCIWGLMGLGCAKRDDLHLKIQEIVFIVRSLSQCNSSF